MESASDGTYLLDGSDNIILDPSDQARQQRRNNQAMGNTIRNVSINSLRQ
jgi:hypothetical protein